MKDKWSWSWSISSAGIHISGRYWYQHDIIAVVRDIPYQTAKRINNTIKTELAKGNAKRDIPFTRDFKISIRDQTAYIIPYRYKVWKNVGIPTPRLSYKDFKKIFTEMSTKVENGTVKREKQILGKINSQLSDLFGA